MLDSQTGTNEVGSFASPTVTESKTYKETYQKGAYSQV
ncbi:hypothetical protein CLV24_14415 [Pontibacter ummariensis]|uniref:Uncharacterized protein n=1 Tax=Pontibacter ummariensis TaxID=1610492 RepID=A0A239LM45_9BACT|nr:hypothetical protein CLV24_14415 [Pontibacter ummariensis]SNT31646.1 hypothetical protein SAMN06296052_14515 [Pontibacter ummariensis]